ncbi:MAG: cell division protein FtsL [Thermodesulfobacteriota bacterium]|nr:cell division protein FtsL [Thermodesulfobacteriota bacterium]
MANKKKATRKTEDNKVIGIWIVIMLVFIGEVFFYAWCRVQCVRLQYDIGRQTARAEALAATQKDLRIEQARLKSPARIMTIAKRELGLVMPGSEQIVVVP